LASDQDQTRSLTTLPVHPRTGYSSFTPNHQPNPLMCCALHHLPVIDVRSDHPFSMSDNNSASPPLRRREDTFPLRTVVPLRDIASQGQELGQELASRSQGRQLSEDRQIQHSKRKSASPPYDLNELEPAGSTTQQMRQSTPRSNFTDYSPGAQPQPYSSAPSPSSEPVIGGQVCR
jgi:hypothetical protein